MIDPAALAAVEPRVLDTIPHRPPFLFVDRVLSLDEEAKKLVALRTLRDDEAFYAGHYPGRPITPGVLVCEAIFQAGALLAGLTFDAATLAGKKPVLTRIRDARFRRPVLPGETVRLEVELTDHLGAAYVFKGKALVGDEESVRIGFTCALVDESEIPGSDA